VTSEEGPYSLCSILPDNRHGIKVPLHVPLLRHDQIDICHRILDTDIRGQYSPDPVISICLHLLNAQ